MVNAKPYEVVYSRLKHKLHNMNRKDLEDFVMEVIEALYLTENGLLKWWEVDGHVTMKEWDANVVEDVGLIVYRNKLRPTDVLNDAEIKQAVDEFRKP